MLRNSCLVVVLALLILGCAPVAQVDRSASPQYETGQQPSLETVSRARVGDTIFEQFSYSTVRRITLQDGYTANIGFAQINAPQGSELLRSKALNRPAFCTAQSTYFVPGSARSVCFFDADGDRKLEQYWIVGTLGTFVYDAPQLAYDEQVINKGNTGVRKQLIFQGRAGSVLKVGYREYLDAMARPAFAQDLSYDTAGEHPKRILFRNVEISVVQIGNNEITYVVHSGF